jgi:LPXTG-motif cell wall-anchored protein
VFTPAPGAPFADASRPSGETIPAEVLWAGLGGVIALTGGGTYLYRRWRRPATLA